MRVRNTERHRHPGRRPPSRECWEALGWPKKIHDKVDAVELAVFRGRRGGSGRLDALAVVLDRGRSCKLRGHPHEREERLLRADERCRVQQRGREHVCDSARCEPVVARERAVGSERAFGDGARHAGCQDVAVGWRARTAAYNDREKAGDG